MVLANATAEADGFAENAPTSDIDPYSSTDSTSLSTNTSRTEYPIDTTNFARPFPIIGPLSGFTSEFTAKILQARLQHVGLVAGRPVTAEEAQILAHYTAKEVATVSYGNPVGGLLGIVKALTTQETFSFPFYKPDLDKFPKEAFPTAKSPWITGSSATWAWQMLRGGIYGLIGTFIGTALLTSYATSVRIVAENQDKRLKDLSKAMVEGYRKKAGEFPNTSRTPNTPRAPGVVDGMKEQDASALWKDYTQGMSDDASPSGGSGVYGDINEQEGKAAAMSQTRGAWSKGTGQLKYQESSEPVPFFGQGDELPSSSAEPVSRSAQSVASGSAWDRVRMQASTQNKNKTSSWTTRQSPSVDEHSYRNDEVDRHLARDDAQKDFDAKVERERRGDNFSGGGGERKW